MVLECGGYVSEVMYNGGAEVLHAMVINSDPFPVANTEETNVEGIKHESRLPTDVYIGGYVKLGIRPVASSARPLGL